MNSQEWYSAMTLWWDNSSLLCAMVLWLYIPWFWGNMIILGYTMIMLCSYGGILLYGADSQPCSHSNRKYFLCAFFIILCYANECMHYHHSTTNYIWSSHTWSSLIWLFLIQLHLHLDSPDVIWGTLRGPTRSYSQLNNSSLLICTLHDFLNSTPQSCQNFFTHNQTFISSLSSSKSILLFQCNSKPCHTSPHYILTQSR